MTWSLHAGRFLDSDIRIHMTFFMLPAYVGVAAWQAGGMMVMFEMMALLGLMLLCILAHEFGHILTARHYRIDTPTIYILPIGGMAMMDRMPRDPRQELAVIAAGPLTNLVIFLILTGLLGVGTTLSGLRNPDGSFDHLWSNLAMLNIIMIFFNMLPVFPMDGGRILRAALALLLRYRVATRIATFLGMLFAGGFVGYGAIQANIFPAMIGAFVFLGAYSEAVTVLGNGDDSRS